MIRSSRLMAAILAALFAAVLAAPAYATRHGSTCDAHSRTFWLPAARRRAPSSTTSNANGKRDAGEPGLAGWRIWADYDNDGVRDTGEPYDDTDSIGGYAITGIKPTRQPQTARTAPRQEVPPARAAPRRRHRRLDLLVPERLDLRRLRHRQGRRLRLRPRPDRRPSTPKVTGKDFGNYKKPKITVIKKLVPASDSGRFDLKVDGKTVKAAAGDGGTGSTSSAGRAPGHRDRGARHRPRRLHGVDPARHGELAKTYGPGWVHVTVGRRRHLHDHQHPPGQGRDRRSRPTRTRRRHAASASPASRARSASPDGGVKTITRVAPRTSPTR